MKREGIYGGPGKVQLMAHDAAMMVILSDRAAATPTKRASRPSPVPVMTSKGYITW